MVSTNILYALVEDAKRAAVGGVNFRDALFNTCSVVFKAFKEGRIPVGANSGDISRSWAAIASGRLSLDEIAELPGYLLRRYDETADLLVKNDPSHEPTEAEIRTQMLKDFRAVKSYTSNFMYLAK